jgi:hypothetical protein
MISGICDRCAAKSDRELQDAALNELRTVTPDARRLDLSPQVGRA